MLRYIKPDENCLNIWTYWENLSDEKMPAYIRLCFEALQRKTPNAVVHLVTPENIMEYLPDLIPGLDGIRLKDNKKSSIPQKVDYIRIKLLHDYGGLWLDIDSILLRDITEMITSLLHQFSFIGMQKKGKKPPYIVNNFMASIKGGAIVKKYLGNATMHIQSKIIQKDLFEWNEIGSELLTPIVENNSEEVYIFDEKVIHPFDFTESRLLEKKLPKNKIIDLLSENLTKETLIVMLYNSRFSDKFKGRVSSDILYHDNSIISFLLRHSLEVNTIADRKRIRGIIYDKKSDPVDIIIKNIEAKNHHLPLIDRDLLYSEKYNIFYASCSKNACSKIKTILASLENNTSYNAQSPHNKKLTGLKGLTDLRHDQALDVLTSKGTFRFCFVRNPFDRAISCFLNRINSLGIAPYDNPYFLLADYQKNLAKIRHWRKSSGINHVLSSPITFYDFINFICQQDPYEMDRHWMFQTDCLHPELIKYDFIGRVENFGTDIQQLLNHVGLNYPYSSIIEKVNPSIKYNRKSYFDNELKSIFVKKYHKDFTAYNYSMEL